MTYSRRLSDHWHFELLLRAVPWRFLTWGEDILNLGAVHRGRISVREEMGRRGGRHPFPGVARVGGEALEAVP